MADVLPGDSSEFVGSSWRIQNGLPSDRVRAVLQTGDGYVWVATFNGIARFDGVRFERFNDANTPQLRNSLANCLFEDKAGRLWVGSDTGEITWRDSAGFHPLPTPKSWLSAPVDYFAQSGDGTVYALSRDGIALVIKDRKADGMIGDVSSKRFAGLAEDSEGQVWAIRYGGALERFAGSKEVPDGPAPVARAYRNIAPARQGGLWIRDGSSLRRWWKGKWADQRTVKSMTTRRGVVLREDNAGSVWVGTATEGAFVVSPSGLVEHLTRTNGLGNDLVSSIITDQEGDTWIGTDGGGLELLRHRVLSMVSPPDHWQDRAVLSVAPGAPNGLWVGTEGAGVYRLQDGQFAIVKSPANPAARVVRSVLQSSSGQLWAGTQGYGVLKGAGDKGLVAQNDPVLTPTLLLYYALFEDKNGAIWMGTQDGLVKYDNGRWERLGTDLILAEVRSIAQAPDGAIWAGLRGGGLARYKEGKFTQFRQGDGLSYNFIWCLCADEDGTIWIGTPGAGLIRLRDGRFASFTTRDGLPSDFICNIQADKAGHLWIGSYAGIFRIDKASLERRAAGGGDPLNYVLLDMSDGLTSLEIAGGNQPSACATSDGRLWYATSAGLAAVDPSRIRPNLKAPPVHIEEALIDGQRVPLPVAGQPLVVPPGGRPVEIRYTAPSYPKPERCRFRYKLQPLEENWVDAAERRSAYYSHLPPREYRFRVIACNNDGLWNEEGASVSFVVQPYLWEHWWFGPACWLTGLSLAAVAVLGGIRQRHQHRLEAVERARAVERERVRIARDLHDDLGSGLTDISMTSELARDPALSLPEARQYFSEITRASTDMVNALDEIVWAVNPKNDHLNSLTTYFCQFAERFLQAAHVSCRFQIPDDLPSTPLNAEQRHNLFLAFKESLQNTVKHSGATSLRLTVSADARRLRLEVEDNGRGFEEGPAKAGADGLRNMRERLEQIGGRCEVSSAPGRGTRVAFILPLSEPPARIIT